MEEEITYFTDALEDLIADFKTYGYTYDENNDVYVSSDGSDEIDLDEWVDDNCYSLDRDKAKEIAEDVINGGSIPYADELAEEIASDDAEYYDFSDRKSIDQALEDIGSNFNFTNRIKNVSTVNKVVNSVKSKFVGKTKTTKKF